jgi:hypothetical protein
MTPLHQDKVARGVESGWREFGWEVVGAVCWSGMWSPLFRFRLLAQLFYKFPLTSIVIPS